MSLKSGNMLYFRGNEDNFGEEVGFITRRRHTKDIYHLESISTRIYFVMLRLNQRYSIKNIQVHAPISIHSDKKVEFFYENISRAMSKILMYFIMIVEDFANLRRKQDENELFLRKYGIGWER